MKKNASGKHHSNTKPDVTEKAVNEEEPAISSNAQDRDNIITFSDITYSLPDGYYAAMVSQSRIIIKGGTKRWLVGFQLDGKSTEFVSTFLLPLNKSSAFGGEVYGICKEIEELAPGAILDHHTNFKITNQMSNGRTYSNIVQFTFSDEEIYDGE